MKEFAQFRLDTVNQCLWRQLDTGKDERILLTPKAFAVLLYLTDHAGQLATRDKLLAAVWPDTIVEPGVLNNQILNIRRALGDTQKISVFIETLPRRGYRFIAPIREGESGAMMGGDFPLGKLVGRAAVAAELQDLLAQALKGQRQIAFITGELGIGKTTLADEFQRQIAASTPGIRVARGQCIEGYGGAEPYYPMLEGLGQLCRGSEGQAVVQALAAQAPTWLVQFPALVTREHREMLEREILGATRKRMLREIGNALDLITAASPLVLVFEDLHWVDRSTVDLISALARYRGPARLMILGTYRPADLGSANQPLKALTEDLVVHGLCREIALGPLTRAEITEYLTSEAPEAEPPGALVALLNCRSEGNPLFMVAALEHLMERGFVKREQGAWQLRVSREEIDPGVPEGLREIIEAQIEDLSPEEQSVLEAGSLQGIGRSGFTVAPSAAAGELDPAMFEAVCERLSRRHFIVRPDGSRRFSDGTVSPRYEFVHVLYREVCYQQISQGRRVKMHRQLGEWIESHWEPLNEAGSWLAEHFEKGEDWPRAIQYFHLAADTAGRRFAFREAAAILDHALEVVSKLPEADRAASEIAILEKLAAIHMMLADDTHAIEHYEALAGRAAQSGLIDVEVRALLDMAAPLSWTNSRRSLEILERVLRLSDRQKDPLLRARTRARCFGLRLCQEWNPRSAEEFDHAFAEILNAHERRILAPYLASRGIIRGISSEYREARRSLIESRAIQFEMVEESPYVAFPYLAGQRIVLPLNLLFLGEWGGALREIEDAIALLDKNANYLWAQRMRLGRAFVHLHAMDFAGVLAMCNSAVPLVRNPELRPAPDSPTLYPSFRASLVLVGSAAAGLGNYESALEHLLAARAGMDRMPVIWDWWWRMQVESALTELWLAKGDLAQARSQAESFLKIALATAEHTWQALAWEANARAAIAAGDWNRANECIAKALLTIEGYEVPLAAWRVHGAAAQLYVCRGENDSAEHQRELSRAIVLKLANSLAAEDPLRQIFLSAPTVRQIIGARHRVAGNEGLT